MRFCILVLALFSAFALAGCGGSSGSSATPASHPYVAPQTYMAAVTAAITPPPLAAPVGPWDCAPVDIYGTPNTVVTLHGANGATRDYTADANGRFNSANGYTLLLLLPPKSTIWLTVKSPTDAQVVWTGGQFTSDDGLGVTYTTGVVTSMDDPTTVIRVTVTPAPTGNG
jgi:hypothetical protein